MAARKAYTTLEPYKQKGGEWIHKHGQGVEWVDPSYKFTKPPPPLSPRGREREVIQGETLILCMGVWWKLVNWVDYKVNQPKQCEKCMASREFQAASHT